MKLCIPNPGSVFIIKENISLVDSEIDLLQKQKVKIIKYKFSTQSQNSFIQITLLDEKNKIIDTGVQIKPYEFSLIEFEEVSSQISNSINFDKYRTLSLKSPLSTIGIDKRFLGGIEKETVVRLGVKQINLLKFMIVIENREIKEIKNLIFIDKESKQVKLTNVNSLESSKKQIINILNDPKRLLKTQIYKDLDLDI